MTSPTDPPKRSIRDRIDDLFDRGGSGRYVDSEEQHTRNVTAVFVLLIVGVAVIAVAGLAFGFWESNLKPLANVRGTEIGRGEWQDRQKLEEVRVERGESQVRSALAAGTIDADSANRRLSLLASSRQQPSAVMEDLVDLIYQAQLAEEEGVTLSEDELDLAVANDGGLPELRKLEGLVLATDAQVQGQPTSAEELAELRERADAAYAELLAGAAVADIVDEYAIEQIAEFEGDYGYIAEGDLAGIPEWEAAIFAAELGGITPIIEGPLGEFYIGVVADIVPPMPDPEYADAVTDVISEDAWRRNVELEATAEALREHVTTEAMAADYDQVRLAEILVAGRTFIDPEDDEGEIRASHILYEPEGVDEDGEPIAVADLPADDPAWEVAETAAEEAAAQLRNVEDAELRQWAFARRAFEDSMGPSGPRGGDLGFFTRDTMVEPFGNAVFDAEDPQPGDIIGPVRSEFGWHVIQYTDFREPLADRLAVVEAALAEPDADFAEVARERSEAESAADGGDIGWQVLEQLDDLTVAALSATEVGGITTAVDGDRGWYIYQLLEEATRPLDGEAAAELEESAFDEWYSERRFGAVDAERISIDDSVYEDDATTPGTLPMGGQGG